MLKGGVAFDAEAYRTYYLKKCSVADYFATCSFGCFLVEICFIRVRRINNLFAFDAEHMIVQIGTKIISVRTRNTHMTNFSVLRQAVQIAINRSVADIGIFLMYILINLLGGRMVMS